MSIGKIVSGLLGILILLFIWYVWYIFNRGELSEKGAWVAVQSAELQYRKVPGIEMPIVLPDYRGTKYTLLGLANDNPDNPITWIILNEAAPVSGIYALPEKGSLYVTCKYITKLQSEVKIEPSVLSFLQSKCT